MVASGFFNEVPARDAVASLSHRRAVNKCGAAILPSDSGTALGWKKTIIGSEAMARPAISTFCRAGLALQLPRPVRAGPRRSPAGTGPRRPGRHDDPAGSGAQRPGTAALRNRATGRRAGEYGRPRGDRGPASRRPSASPRRRATWTRHRPSRAMPPCSPPNRRSRIGRQTLFILIPAACCDYDARDCSPPRSVMKMPAGHYRGRRRWRPPPSTSSTLTTAARRGPRSPARRPCLGRKIWSMTSAPVVITGRSSRR